jgi:hypothetical protein
MGAMLSFLAAWCPALQLVQRLLQRMLVENNLSPARLHTLLHSGITRLVSCIAAACGQMVNSQNMQSNTRGGGDKHGCVFWDVSCKCTHAMPSTGSHHELIQTAAQAASQSLVMDVDCCQAIS